MKSGSADTCLGNTIVNYATHLFATAFSSVLTGDASKRGIIGELEDLCARFMGDASLLPTPKDIMNRTMFMILGDDNVTWADADVNMAAVPIVLNALGLVSKLKAVPRPEDVVFLNNWFLEREPGEFMAIPNFYRLLGKIGYAVKEQPDPMSYIHQVFQAFQKSLSGCTTPATVINHLVQLAGDRRTPVNKGKCKVRTITTSRNVLKALEHQYRIWGVTELKPTPMSDANFNRRCRVSSDEQKAVCDEMLSIRDLPVLVGAGRVTELIRTCT
jgi:hypothetical protein